MQCYCNVLCVIYEYMAEVTALVYVVAPFLMCMVKVIALMYDVKHSCDVIALASEVPCCLLAIIVVVQEFGL